MNKEKLILDTIKEKAYRVNRIARPVYGQGQYDMVYEILDAVEKIIESEPDEITRLHTLIEQQGKELNRRDQLIRELDEKCDYWEREAKKYCAVLGGQKIKLKQLECEMCRLEDTEECKQC